MSGVLSGMVRVGCFLGVVIAVAGCGGDEVEVPDLGTVTGTVTLDGKPLPDVMVAFQPETGRASMGKTDATGKYDLSYFGEEKGALLGKHSVSVTTPTEAPDPTGKLKDPIPAKYNTKTTLSEEVKAGENVIDLKLESK